MGQIPKGEYVKEPICRDCAIYFSTTVTDNSESNNVGDGSHLDVPGS